MAQISVENLKREIDDVKSDKKTPIAKKSKKPLDRFQQEVWFQLTFFLIKIFEIFLEINWSC